MIARFMSSYKLGVTQMLHDIEDHSLKSFVASRCASRQLRVDAKRSARLARAEERVVSLEKEKPVLEEALTSACVEAKKNFEALEAALQEARKIEEAEVKAEEA